MTNEQVVVELQRVAAEHGGELKAADVVDAARPETSPLHDSFEWDDSEAAEQYRLWQARQLIRVTVQMLGAGEDAVLSRVFVSLTTDRTRAGGGYRVMLDVLGDEGQRRQMLSDALEEMKRFRRKYGRLVELTKVFDEMEKVIATQQPLIKV
jgi:hypothetical protein